MLDPTKRHFPFSLSLLQICDENNLNTNALPKIENMCDSASAPAGLRNSYQWTNGFNHKFWINSELKTSPVHSPNQVSYHLNYAWSRSIIHSGWYTCTTCVINFLYIYKILMLHKELILLSNGITFEPEFVIETIGSLIRVAIAHILYLGQSITV